MGLSTFRETINHNDGSLGAICCALTHPRCSCKYLDLSKQRIAADGALRVAQALSTNNSLLSLDLSCNDFRDEGAVSFAPIIVTDSPLISLNLSGNNINLRGAMHIAQAISTNKSLVNLDLYSNSIGDEGATRIFEALSTNKSLVYLNLGCNNIGSEGAMSIAQALKANKSLVSLDLSENEIGDNGAAIIALAISSHESLLNLKLQMCGISVKGAASIAQAIMTNKVLACLNIDDNKIGDEGAMSIAHAISTNNSLVCLHLGHNNIDDTGAMEFARGIVVNSSLMNLHLKDNKFGNQGAQRILEALLTNKSLVSLDLSCTYIDNEIKERVMQLLSTKKSLGRSGRIIGETLFFWFTWLIHPITHGASLLLLIETKSKRTSAIVGGAQSQAIPLCQKNFLVQLDNHPLTQTPSKDLFNIPFEVLDWNDCQPCSYPSQMAVSIGVYWEIRQDNLFCVASTRNTYIIPPLTGKAYFECNLSPVLSPQPLPPSRSLLSVLTQELAWWWWKQPSEQAPTEPQPTQPHSSVVTSASPTVAPKSNLAPSPKQTTTSSINNSQLITKSGIAVEGNNLPPIDGISIRKQERELQMVQTIEELNREISVLQNRNSELKAQITTLEEARRKDREERTLEQQEFHELQTYNDHVLSHVELGRWSNVLTNNTCKQSQIRITFEELPYFDEVVCSSCPLDMVVTIIIARKFGVESTQQVVSVVVSDTKEDLLTNTSRTLLELKTICTLGIGSFGSVFKCLHTPSGIHVAVKALHESIMSEFNITKFQEEAMISAKFRHPNIVSCLGTCTHHTRGL
ncbi:Protein NLRC3 [Pelomyxa schiedti]|nr:Protein NLRC3 [Pelomyxa schiedti]